MRITLDATSMLLRSAGVKSYNYHFIQNLRAVAGPGDDIRAFPFLSDLGALDHSRSPRNLPGTAARLAVLQAVNRLGGRVLDAALGKTDVFHAGVLVRSAPTKAKLTATILDLTSWVMPQHHTQATAKADRLFAERMLTRADGLIAISENTRQDAVRLLGIAPERIRVIHPSLPDSYFDASPSARAKPYVLYVGTIEPRKNLPVLLDAWNSLHSSLKEAFELVIAGMAGWDTPETVARVKAESTYLGYVAESEMPGLVAGATLVVFPSLYEGFGFPVVQAMAARVPVITSNVSCLPEVAGGAALLVDPRSPAELGRAIANLLESPEERQRLAELGRRHAERYRWQRSAAESLDFFRSQV